MGLMAGKIRRWVTTLTIALLAGADLSGAGVAVAREFRPDANQTATALSTVTGASLPAEAQQTYRLILSGGPFQYEKDGSVFGNRERLLPRQPRGYYREYTVPTPGSKDRGARRIVCGGRQPQNPDGCFYTNDHYASFRRIVP
jgi:ribonuclease T1